MGNNGAATGTSANAEGRVDKWLREWTQFDFVNAEMNTRQQSHCYWVGGHYY